MNRRNYYNYLFLLSYISASLLMIGCETTYGIHRRAEIDEFPDIACIRNVLNLTAEIQDIKEVHTDNHYRTYIYEGDKLWVYVYIYKKESGKVDFMQYQTRINNTLSEDEIETTLRVMRHVERKLEEQCNMVGLQSKIIEECTNIRCK